MMLKQGFVEEVTLELGLVGRVGVYGTGKGIPDSGKNSQERHERDG